MSNFEQSGMLISQLQKIDGSRKQMYTPQQQLHYTQNPIHKVKQEVNPQFILRKQIEQEVQQLQNNVANPVNLRPHENIRGPPVEMPKTPSDLPKEIQIEVQNKSGDLQHPIRGPPIINESNKAYITIGIFGLVIIGIMYFGSKKEKKEIKNE